MFAIPPGSLGDAAIAIGRQAGVSVSIPDPRLAGLRVPGVRGRYSAEAALRRLMTGSPARLIAIGGSAFRIDRAPLSLGPSRQPTRVPLEPRVVDNEPILVTATKRPIALSDVPGSIAVLNFAQIGVDAQSGGSEVIERFDSAVSSTHLGPGRNKFFIRGIADSSFNGQTQATVGEYLGEARLNYNATDPGLRLYDVRSIEVLPGPQGTLYGAGTIGGVIRLNPNDPRTDQAGGSIRGSVGLTEHGSASSELAGTFNLPLTVRAAVRALGYTIIDGGYIDNIRTGRDDVNRVRTVGGRVSARVDVSSDVTLRSMVAVQRIKAADGQYADRELGPLERATAFPEPFSSKIALGNLSLEARSGPYRIVATTSAVRQRLFEAFDATRDDYSLVLSQWNRTTLYSGEVRVSRDWTSGGGWLAGLSLVENRRRRSDFEAQPQPLASHPDLRNRVNESTAFGEIEQPLTGTLHVTAGLRATRVRTGGHLDGQPALSSSETRLLPSAALSLDVVSGAKLFARVQESFRPGGYILREGKSLHLDSDRARSWESGIRFTGLGPFALNGGISASFTRWSRVQVDVIDPDGLPSTTNLGDGRVWTIDGQVEAAISPASQVDVGFTRNWSRLRSERPSFVPVNPAPLPNVADWNAQASLRTSRNLADGRSVTFLAWLRYVGKSTLGIGPGLDRPQGRYLDSGVEADLNLKHFTIFASLANLFDQRGNRFALGSLLALDRIDQVTPMRPRTVRLGLTSNF